MGMLKRNCNFMPIQCSPFALSRAYAPKELHPSLNIAIHSLDDFIHWVSGVVLPIAFQWIYENRTQVYAGIPDAKKDDVGVVIAAAFQLVKNLDAYKYGMDEFEKYCKDPEDPDSDDAKMNPVWEKITKDALQCITDAFQGQGESLSDTIRRSAERKA
jgi:hypothetical protein